MPVYANVGTLMPLTCNTLQDSGCFPARSLDSIIQQSMYVVTRSHTAIEEKLLDPSMSNSDVRGLLIKVKMLPLLHAALPHYKDKVIQ